METNNTAESLASYVAPDDAGLPRREFLFAVATRILDDLHIEHDLKLNNPQSGEHHGNK